jgi:hypothetical protein
LGYSDLDALAPTLKRLVGLLVVILRDGDDCIQKMGWPRQRLGLLDLMPFWLSV